MRPKHFSRRDFLKISAVAGGVLAAGSLLSKLPGSTLFTIQETRLLMGTIINLSLVTDNRSAGERAVQTTFQEMERLVTIFNFRQADSPLFRLNCDERVSSPPKELLQVIRQAIRFGDLTDGAFDMTVKPLLDLYVRVHDEQGGLPDDADVSQVARLVDYQKVIVDDDYIGFAIPGMGVTLDGIAKGFIVDAGAAFLKNLGFVNILVEAGGDLMASGTNEHDSPWRIAIRSPRENSVDYLAKYEIQNRATATSGDYMRSFTSDFVNHHIIDPRTGHSPRELASVSVIAPTAVLADGIATAVMVMGKSGLQFVEGLSDCEAYVITKDQTVLKTSGFPEG